MMLVEIPYLDGNASMLSLCMGQNGCMQSVTKTAECPILLSTLPDHTSVKLLVLIPMQLNLL